MDSGSLLNALTRDEPLLAGGEESETCETRNGAASALLHIDESDVIEKLNRQRSKNKNKKRSELHHVQTGMLFPWYAMK